MNRIRFNGFATRILVVYMLSRLADPTLCAAEPPVILAPFKVSALSSIEVDIRVAQHKITKVTVISIRRGSPAERVGLSPGMDVVTYRGTDVVGQTLKEFEDLRTKPLRPDEPGLSIGVTLSTGLIRTLSIPLPNGMKSEEAAGSQIDPFVEGITYGPDAVSAYDFLFRHSSPIDLSSSNATRRLGDLACEEIMKWQIEPRRQYQDISWAVPIIKNNKMVGWRIASRETDTIRTANEDNRRLADYLRVNYFNLKERPQAYPNIESDIRASFERSSKFKKDESIGLFSLLVDEQNRVLGFWVGIRVPRDDVNWAPPFDPRLGR